MSTNSSSTATLFQYLSAIGLSAVLLGIAFLPIPSILPAFFALVPLLWLCQNTENSRFLLAATISMFLANLIGSFDHWSYMSSGVAIFILIKNTILYSLPWLFHQQISQRHNAKLGYWALALSWVVVEWARGLWDISWQGNNLGLAIVPLPILSQWFAWTGVLGGTLWIILLNIFIFRYFWPTHTVLRSRILFNAVLLIIGPIIFSIILFVNSGTSKGQANKEFCQLSPNFKTQKAYNANSILLCPSTDSLFLESLDGAAAILAVETNSSGDSLQKALWIQAGTKNQVNSTPMLLSGIFGTEKHAFYYAQPDGIATLLGKASAIFSAESVRLAARQKAQLLAYFDSNQQSSFYYRRLCISAQARVLENNVPILFSSAAHYNFSIDAANKTTWFTPNQTPHCSNIQPQSSNNFYTQYGDLLGRIALFIVIWFALATIVKPFRK